MNAARTDNQPIPDTLEGWPYDIRTIRIAGEAISYTDEGAGPTLLLVHDGMNSFLWVHIVGRLRHRFRVVTLDFPGSGLSPEGTAQVGLEADSLLLEEFTDALRLEKYTLVAHDLGGCVGVGLATRRPEHVEGLVLVNTFAWPPDTMGLSGMMRLMGSTPMRALNSGTNLLARASSTRFGVGRHFDQDQRRGYLRTFARKTSRRRLHELMRSALTETDYLKSVESGLARLADRPTLTIFGQRNDPFGFQERWTEHFPNLERMVIRGGYHFPMCDDPDGVAERITQWHTERVRT